MNGFRKRALDGAIRRLWFGVCLFLLVVFMIPAGVSIMVGVPLGLFADAVKAPVAGVVAFAKDAYPAWGKLICFRFMKSVPGRLYNWLGRHWVINPRAAAAGAG